MGIVNTGLPRWFGFKDRIQIPGVIVIVEWVKSPGNRAFSSSLAIYENADFNHFMTWGQTNPITFSALKRHAQAIPGN
jgi:hypothetical protein